MPKDNIKKQVKGDGLIDESTSSIKEVDPKVANSKPINKKSDLIGDFVDKSLGGVRKWFTKRTEANKKAAKNKKIESKEENSDKLPEKDNQKNSEELNAGEDKNGSLKQEDSAKKGSFSDLFSFFSNKKNETTQGNHKFDLAGTLDLSPEHMAKLSPEEKKQIIEAEKIFREGVASIRDLIAPSYFESSLKYLRLGGLFVRSFYVFSYPRFIETNWLSPVINMEAILDVSQYIYPMESSKIMNTLRRKVTQMSASVHMNQSKGVVSDVGLETALEDAEDLRVRLQRGEEKLFQFGLYFTIYADNEKSLEQISKKIESLLGGKLVLTKRADFQMEHAFNSTLPMCFDEVDVVRNMNTSPLSSTFPFTSSTLTSNEGVLYGLNRHNDSLIIFDRFSLENANSVMFAVSGAGKSYGVKLEVLRSLMMGTDVIIIDPENEYEPLSEVVGGSYLKVSLNSDKRINPFDLPQSLKDETLKPGDLLRSNIINLHGLLKLMLGDVSVEEDAMLDKALIDVYSVKGMTMDKISYEGSDTPTMEDLYDILTGMDGADTLATKVEKYTKGTFAGIFNKPTNIELDKGLMVFSIRDLEDSLRPIAMYIILNYIWGRVKSELKKRILVIDEAWSLMQHEDSAKFLFGLVKRARKYWLGITTITQDVDDFMKSPYGKPIITNSSIQTLLKQSPSSMEVLTKAFNLTEGEKYMLLNSAVGQGLFFAGNQHAAIQVIASYTEDKIVTTNPEEIAALAAQEAEFGTEESLPTLEEEKAADSEVLGGGKNEEEKLEKLETEPAVKSPDKKTTKKSKKKPKKIEKKLSDEKNEETEVKPAKLDETELPTEEDMAKVEEEIHAEKNEEEKDGDIGDDVDLDSKEEVSELVPDEENGTRLVDESSKESGSEEKEQ